jgi:hypothetical protein
VGSANYINNRSLIEKVVKFDGSTDVNRSSGRVDLLSGGLVDLKSKAMRIVLIYKFHPKFHHSA